VGRGFDPHPRSARLNGPVAQWSEQGTHNPLVVGSIPTWPTGNFRLAMLKKMEGETHVPSNNQLSEFDDIFAANQTFAASFEHSHLTGIATRGLAIVTCMDSRINPLAVTGMQAGDAKILRNAGARVTDDVLRTLVLATYLLGVKRVLVMPHTDCRMANNNEAEIHAMIDEQHGVDTRSIEFRTVDDQQSALISDVTRIRTFPLLPKDLVVVGAVYDVATGLLNTVDCDA
jgi:carbonic anhydrase